MNTVREPPRPIRDPLTTTVQQVLDVEVFVTGIVAIDDALWAIYGQFPYDGNVIAAEFDHLADAESAFGRIAALQHGPGNPWVSGLVVEPPPAAR